MSNLPNAGPPPGGRLWEKRGAGWLTGAAGVDPRAVRAWVRGEVERLGAEGIDLDDLDVIVSEVATNARRHTTSGEADGGVRVAVRSTPDRVRVAITDDGGASETPSVKRGEPWATSGRGLALVEMLADAWGHETGDDGRRQAAGHHLVRGPASAVCGGHGGTGGRDRVRTGPRTWRAAAGAVAVPLRKRTRLGHAEAARRLRLLELALIHRGWHCLRLYAPAAGPLMWVYAGAGVREVGTLVTAWPAAGGGWWYHRSPDGRRRPVRLAPCGDTIAAARRLDDHLKPRLYPGTFSMPGEHDERAEENR